MEDKEQTITQPECADAIQGLITNVNDIKLRRNFGVSFKNPRFDKTVEKLRKLHHLKGNDYANEESPYANFERAAAFAGVNVDIVFAVLIGVKEARLRELTSSGKTPNNEAIQDTRLDAANYAVLRASYYEE